MSRATTVLNLNAFSADTNSDVFRRQEFLLVSLNCVALLCIWIIHLLFEPYVRAIRDSPASVLILLRFIEQVIEARYLWRRKAPFTDKQLRLYSHLSIWLNICFTVTVSLLSRTDEAHFLVLLAIPVVAASLRYSLPGVMAVSFTTSGLLFFELWMFYLLHPELVATHKPMEHHFELGTMVIVYPIMGLLLHLLVKQMKNDAKELRIAYVDLDSAQARLIKEEKMAAVGRLTSIISHEIRNPVATIASALEMIDKKGEQKESDRELITMAVRESKRLEVITRDLLTYASPHKPERRSASVKTSLEHVVDLLKPRMEERGQSVEVDCPESLAAWMDPFQIHRALLNLAYNALDHTPDGMGIILGAELSGTNAVTMYVENPGEPIPEAHRDSIFEPFFTMRNEGTGLGLAICLGIAESHGGSIELAVNEPGRVRFVISLPEDEVEGLGND